MQSIKDCTRPSRKRSWCETHYSRFKAHGDPLASPRVRLPASCETSGCEQKPLAKKLCKKHYYRQRAQLLRDAVEPQDKPAPKACSVDTCDSKAARRGWCGAHYQRWRRFGDALFHPPPAVRTCTMAGCDGVTNARGLCSRHYYRWQTYGDPAISKNRPRVRQSISRLALVRCVVETSIRGTVLLESTAAEGASQAGATPAASTTGNGSNGLARKTVGPAGSAQTQSTPPCTGPMFKRGRLTT
jgi:hypothetical protein